MGCWNFWTNKICIQTYFGPVVVDSVEKFRFLAFWPGAMGPDLPTL